MALQADERREGWVCDMIDVTTKRPLKVSKDGDAGPYVMVPVALLAKVQALLDAKRIRYWVDEEAISVDGKPEVTVINLSHQTDPDEVQRILDSVS
jgi:hypothetical protein